MKIKLCKNPLTASCSPIVQKYSHQRETHIQRTKQWPAAHLAMPQLKRRNTICASSKTGTLTSITLLLRCPCSCMLVFEGVCFDHKWLGSDCSSPLWNLLSWANGRILAGKVAWGNLLWLTMCQLSNWLWSLWALRAGQLRCLDPSHSRTEHCS